MLPSAIVRTAARRLSGAGPKLISVTGAVAVGKSTFARSLRRALIQQRGERVEIVSTDGFLRSDSDLESAGLLQRKGFPESYDHAALATFFGALHDPHARLSVPVYCHRARGCIGQRELARPDWLIVEGVYAQQPAHASGLESFAIFLDSDLTLIRHWYTQRFLRLHGARFEHTAQAIWRAEQVYTEVNYANYLQHIARLQDAADLVVHKTAAHALQRHSLGRLIGRHQLQPSYSASATVD